jgi:hypothetical protein
MTCTEENPYRKLIVQLQFKYLHRMDRTKVCWAKERLQNLQQVNQLTKHGTPSLIDDIQAH